MGVSQSGFGRSPRPASNGAVIAAILLALVAVMWAATHTEDATPQPQPTPSRSARQ